MRKIKKTAWQELLDRKRHAERRQTFIGGFPVKMHSLRSDRREQKRCRAAVAAFHVRKHGEPKARELVNAAHRRERDERIKRKAADKAVMAGLSRRKVSAAEVVELP